MRKILFFLVLALLGGCVAANTHRANVNDSSSDKLTVGTVQKEIKVGMSGSDVASVLGSPNVVTTDAQRREVWIYDKIHTEKAYSTSSGFGSLILVGGNQGAGASSTEQKTLTVVIKFDENGLVRDYAYRQSSF